MRFEDDDGVIVSLTPTARTLYVELRRSGDRGHGYVLNVYLDRKDNDWRNFELHYSERDRALQALEQLEALFAS